MRAPAYGIGLPTGFRAAGIAAGLKRSGNPDLGLLVSDRPAAAAGVFTRNRVQAAPVLVTKERIERGIARAVVANAGNANACTGPRGIDDARATVEATARALDVPSEDVLVASTGVIGVPLDIALLERGVVRAAAALGDDGAPFAEAILTTDTTRKFVAVEVGGARLVGIAKGSGMIAPEMATMLAFLLTDAEFPAGALRAALHDATAATFNAVTVDGCMSTNDSVLALANGAAGPVDADEFAQALREVCAALARAIVEDGEGATKVVAVQVEGARDAGEARRAARAVADSVLLRCALHGADPNWGRVLAALGASSVEFDPEAVDVWLGGQQMCARGALGPGDREKARAALEERDVEVRIALNQGEASGTVWTNDLSAEYVRINAEYTT